MLFKFVEIFFSGDGIGARAGCMNRSRSRLDRFHDTAKNIKTRKQKATHYKLSLLGSIENKITWTVAKIQLILPEGDVHVVTLEHFVGKVAGVGAQVILCHPFHLQVAPLQHNILTYSTINQVESTNQIWHLMNFSKQPNTRATSTSKQWSLQGSGEDPECFDSDPDPTFHIDSDLNPNFILFLGQFGSYKIPIHNSTYFRFSTFKFYFISNQYRYRYGILCLHEGWANFILIVIPPNMIRIRLLTRGEKMESLSGKML